jgi:hypothetical protein
MPNRGRIMIKDRMSAIQHEFNHSFRWKISFFVLTWDRHQTDEEGNDREKMVERGGCLSDLST